MATEDKLVIGIAWDKEAPNLKPTVLRDLLVIAAELDCPFVEIVAPLDPQETAWCSELLRSVGLTEVKGKSPAILRLYIVEEEIETPDYVEDIIRKVLKQETAPGKFTHGTEDTYYPSLDRASDHRRVGPGLSIDFNKAPPRQQGMQPAQLPINYWQTPFI
jgi:hypothetical protein